MGSKTILFCDNTLWGLLNFRGGVIRYFITKGYKVILVAPQDSLSDLSGIPVECHYIPIHLNRTGTNPIKDIRYYCQLYRIYKIIKPDYIFHYTIKPNIYGSIAAHTLHIRHSAMIAGLGHVYVTRNVGNYVARMMYKYAMRFPERVMVLNKSNYQTLLSHKVVAKEKLMWLKGGEGVDLTKFSSVSLPNHSKPIFLMICRLLYEKGYAEYIAAATKLKGQAEFRIMGPIDTHPSAVPRSSIEEATRRGIITYIAYTPDVISQISEADCIVLPSYGEGLSRVLMEGLAMGRIIVATDIPGCRETVLESKNGYLCAPKSATSLAEALNRVIQLSPQERIQMGKASRQLAEELFDEQIVIRQYEQILHGI